MTEQKPRQPFKSGVDDYETIRKRIEEIREGPKPETPEPDADEWYGC